MVLLRFLSIVICAVLITTGAASDEGVMKAVGDRVSFRPDNSLPLSVTSIIWKQITTAGIVVKAIEWDEGEILIPNPRFKGITEVDEKTGQITIDKLNFEHSGVYTIDINSKEQQQRFTLTVKERVPKPEIKTEPTENPDVVYLRCEYSEPIIWKNSAGETLTGSPINQGESITVKKNGNPETYYTCTLDNGASKETSDPVYERDLFKDGSKSGSGLIAGIVILIILISIIVGVLIFLYKCNEKFKERVDGCFTCFSGPKDKEPELKEVKTNPEHQPLKETEGGQDENNDVKEGEPADTPAGTADSNDNGVEGDYVNSDMEARKKEEKIGEAKAAA